MRERDFQKTPFSHEGDGSPSKHLGDLLIAHLGVIQSRYGAKTHRAVDMWPHIVGPKIASMTQAVRIEEQVLYVKVKNSTLLSLLSTKEDKQKILTIMRKQLPGIAIRDIMFRIG